MAIHPRLEEHKGLRHLKVFSKLLKHVEVELKRTGCSAYDVEIDTARPERSRLARYFGSIDLENVHQVMTVRGVANDSTFELQLPMLEEGWMNPSILIVELPVSSGVAGACQRRALGRKWELEPADKALSKDLTRVLPKVRLDHAWPPLVVQIQVCYTLEPAGDSTIWVTHAGYASRTFGHGVPEVAKYLGAIPALMAALEEHAGA